MKKASTRKTEQATAANDDCDQADVQKVKTVIAVVLSSEQQRQKGCVMGLLDLIDEVRKYFCRNDGPVPAKTAHSLIHLALCCGVQEGLFKVAKDDCTKYQLVDCPDR